MSHHDCGTDGPCGRHRMDTARQIIGFFVGPCSTPAVRDAHRDRVSWVESRHRSESMQLLGLSDLVRHAKILDYLGEHILRICSCLEKSTFSVLSTARTSAQEETMSPNSMILGDPMTRVFASSTAC